MRINPVTEFLDENTFIERFNKVYRPGVLNKYIFEDLH